MKDALRQAVEVGPIRVPEEIKRVEEQLSREYKQLEEENRQRQLEEFEQRYGKDNELDFPMTPDFITLDERPNNNFGSGSSRARQKEIDQLHHQLLNSGPGNDISGVWYFNCPEVADYRGDNENEEVVWKFHPPQRSEK